GKGGGPRSGGVDRAAPPLHWPVARAPSLGRAVRPGRGEAGRAGRGDVHDRRRGLQPPFSDEPATAGLPAEGQRIMDTDLEELLAAWLGDQDPGEERRAALLARLRQNGEFRRAFLEEIRLLGVLRVVQSAEPRWLRLEDEWGWSAQEQASAASL